MMRKVTGETTLLPADAKKEAKTPQSTRKRAFWRGKIAKILGGISFRNWTSDQLRPKRKQSIFRPDNSVATRFISFRFERKLPTAN
jgi:hypothetical protein